MLYGNSGLPRGLLGKEPATAVEYISTRGLYPPRLRLDWVMMDYMYESWNMKIFWVDSCRMEHSCSGES